MNTSTNKEYLAASAPEWNYPEIDGEPPRGKKINILTSGGIAVTGQWREDSNYIAWAPLIKSSKVKEFMSRLIREFPGTDARRDLMKAIFKRHLEPEVAKAAYPNASRHIYTALSSILATVYPTIQFQFVSTVNAYVDLYTGDFLIRLSYPDPRHPDKLEAHVTFRSARVCVSLNAANAHLLTPLINSLYTTAMENPLVSEPYDFVSGNGHPLINAIHDSGLFYVAPNNETPKSKYHVG